MRTPSTSGFVLKKLQNQKSRHPFYHNCQLPTEHWSLNTTYYKTKLLSIIVISRIQMHENEQAVLR